MCSTRWCVSSQSTHDFLIRASPLHRVVEHLQNDQDPNAWLHKLAETPSSSVTNGFDQPAFGVTNGFDQHTPAQQPYFSTFHTDPISQHQRLPARPQLSNQSNTFDATTNSYSLASDAVTNGNGRHSDPYVKLKNPKVLIAVLVGAPSTSISPSTFYANPYQPSHTPPTNPYARSPHAQPAEPQRPYPPQSTYISSWSSLSSSSTPTIPATNEPHQAITIE